MFFPGFHLRPRPYGSIGKVPRYVLLRRFRDPTVVVTFHQGGSAIRQDAGPVAHGRGLQGSVAAELRGKGLLRYGAPPEQEAVGDGLA